MSGLRELLVAAGMSLFIASQVFVMSALVFAWLALIVKGREAIAAAERARKEISINLTIFALDAAFVAPVMAVVVQIIRVGVSTYGVELVPSSFWAQLPRALALLGAILVGDYISYWRHRMEHTRLLWPSHAVHHSDTDMTWLTLSRFHPINRLTTMAVDTAFLAVLGLPAWALVANVMVRHYYGEFIHADLPWTYGPFKAVFVSPVMHRWHHARDVTGAGSNFATVFSLIDRLHGTYYVPGLCTVPLGVNDEMGKGTMGQLMYPFVAWRERFTSARRRKAQPRPVETESV